MNFPERLPDPSQLVTLLCPNRKCMRRVAVMEFLPWSTRPIKPGDIALIDGRTPTRVDKLACSHCFTVFAPKEAAVPQYVVDALNPHKEPDPIHDHA